MAENAEQVDTLIAPIVRSFGADGVHLAVAGDAGTVLGVAVGAAALLIAAVLVFRLHRRRRHGATCLTREQPMAH